MNDDDLQAISYQVMAARDSMSQYHDEQLQALAEIREEARAAKDAARSARNMAAASLVLSVLALLKGCG